MRFEDLSPADQELVNTDFGGLDKVAAEQVKVAAEMYNAGAEMALSTADQTDKLAAESDKEEEKEEEMEEEEKKASVDYGNIIAEGFIDKLAELGEERHGNPAHYIMPYVEEKIAQVGALAALEKFAAARSLLNRVADKLPTRAGVGLLDTAEKAKKLLANKKVHALGEAANPMHNFRAAKSGYKSTLSNDGAARRDMIVHKGVEGAKGAGKVLAYLGAAGGAGAATKKLMSKKKED